MRRCKKQNYTDIEVIRSFWQKSFFEDKYIGIVTVKNVITDEIKTYLGFGKGNNLEEDEDFLITDKSSLELNAKLNSELVIILMMFYMFNGKIDYEELKNICKDCGFEKHIKNIEMLQKKDKGD